MRRVACRPNNYFGREPGVIDAIASYVKPGDKILISVPGLVKPLDDAMMEVFSKSWTAEQMDYIKPAEWWEELLGRSRAVTLDHIGPMNHIGPMKCYGQAWAGNHLPHGNPVSDLSPVVQVADRVQRDIAHPALVPIGLQRHARFAHARYFGNEAGLLEPSHGRPLRSTRRNARFPSRRGIR